MKYYQWREKNRIRIRKTKARDMYRGSNNLSHLLINEFTEIKFNQNR